MLPNQVAIDEGYRLHCEIFVLTANSIAHFEYRIYHPDIEQVCSQLADYRNHNSHIFDFWTIIFN